ncbi:MAG: ATP-dependent helicase [bacterium]|nr:ATP-dependent helicase [bacterium]
MFASDLIRDKPWAEGLNQEQSAAVHHDGGPLLVVAGAGSGKTRTLVARVARLIDTGVPAERILLLTFTRRASSEMLRRVDHLVNRQTAGRVWGGTFHGISHRLLRRFSPAVGLAEGFTILDQADSEAMFGMLRAERGLGEKGMRFPKKETIAAIYSRVVNQQAKLDEITSKHFPWCSEHVDPIRQLFRDYTARKREHNVIDYDDLLLYWRALLESPAADAVKGMFDHVLVDEYQDTNRIQADILAGMCTTAQPTVVGDDAQAIYGFRAAEVENMWEFESRFTGTKRITLDQNYRSTPQVLAVANAVIAEAETGYEKNLWSVRQDGAKPGLVTCHDEPTQAEYVCEQVLARREEGVALRDQAVLFRTSHHSAGLEVELGRRNIPFVKFGGLKFLEAAHIKDLTSMLRIASNPDDELAWNRVLQLIPGIGPATARRLQRKSVAKAEVDNCSVIEAFCELEIPVPAEARPILSELQAALRDVVVEPEMPPAAQIDRLGQFCELVFDRRYEDSVVRLGDIAQLGKMASPHRNRTTFLADMALDPPNSTSDLAGPPHLDDDYLILSTIHSAKGGEWRAVYVIHASDGNIPSDMSLGEPGGLDEERRLFYVALTRAKDHLSVTVPQRFYHRRFGGDSAHSYAPPSRFVEPARGLFEEATAAPSVESAAAMTLVTDQDVVGDFLESLWG